MAEPEELRAFLDDYKTYVTSVLGPAESAVKAFFKAWKDPEYWDKVPRGPRLPSPSPVQSFKHRIKRPESVVDKILRRRELFPDGLAPESFRGMHDCLGARLVVYFLANLPLVDGEIRTNPHLEISTEEPPVAYLADDLHKRFLDNDFVRRDKASGYSSLHYVLRLKPNSPEAGRDQPWFELQVRTLAQEAWSEVEHILGYKPGKRTSLAVRKQFLILSAQLGAVDEHFNFLFEELQRFQEEAPVKDTDPLNAENLPYVLSQLGIGCAQREINGILKLLASRGVATVGVLTAMATNATLDLIASTYLRVEGRPPENFEVAATLADLYGVPRGDYQAAIKTHIEFLRAWDKLRSTFGDPPPGAPRFPQD